MVVKESAWKTQSSTWRAKLGVTENFSPWTQRPSFHGQNLPRTKRVLDLVDCCYVESCKRRKIAAGCFEHGSKNLVADVSQSHGRKPLSDNGILRTLTTSSKLYYYAEDRVLVPREHMALQGYERVEIPSSWTDADIQRISGEAICLPSLAGLLWCLHLTRDLTSLQ